MEHYELRVLCDFLHTGAQAVNTWARPTPLAVNGELETSERGEAVFMEVWSPVTGAGVEEELRKIIPVLDGHEYGPYISINGIRATCMAPPKTRTWAGDLYTFGNPLDATKTIQDPMKNTTLKYSKTITVATLAGPAVAITQNYRIRIWGYVYKDTELPRFGSMIFPYSITERTRNRSVILNKDAIAISSDNWLTLPGGKDQSIPKVNPFARYAYNLLATDGQQGDYQFRFENGQVTEEQENMYFEFDDKDALFITGLGMKGIPGTNLARTGFRIDGDYHPKAQTTRVSMFPTTVGINELNYGHLFPFAPVDHPYFAAIPKLITPYMIWNEIGHVCARDDGVGAVALNTLVAALTGVRLEMRS